MQFQQANKVTASTSGAVDTLLGPVNENFNAGVPNQLGMLNAKNSYSCIVVILQVPMGGGNPAAGSVTVNAIPAVPGGAFAFPSQTQTWSAVPAFLSFILPIAYAPGQLTSFGITFSVTVTNVSITVLGVSSPLIVEVINPPNTPLQVTGTFTPSGTQNVLVTNTGSAQAVPNALYRSDGRTYPLGSNGAEGSLAAANGPNTVVAAPGAGLHLMVVSVNIFNAAAPALSNAKVQGTINGTTRTLLGIGSALEVVSQEWVKGILLDANTAITILGSATPTVVCEVLYDVVA